MQKALPFFADGGSIIMNGSIAGSMGFPAFGVYSASKAALRSFARTWTVDLKSRNIRVNVLSPGTIDTPILEGQPKDAIDGFVALIPRGRWDAPRRSRPPRCSWLRAIPASSRGASSSSTAVSPRSDHGQGDEGPRINSV